MKSFRTAIAGFLAVLLFPALVAAQSLPSPAYKDITVNGALKTPAMTGFVYANGAGPATASPVLPQSKLATTALATTVSVIPSPASNPGDPAHAFDGPSKSPFRHLATISGTAAGTPTTSYTTVFDLAQVQLDAFITAGYNYSTTDTTGRTMIPQQSSYIIMAGQGDATNLDCGGYVNNPTPTRNSNWLADPALTCLGGEIDAVTDSANLVGSELTVKDNGHATTMSGFVSHIYRANKPSPNPKLYTTVNFAASSNSTAAVDAFFTGSGPASVGLDLSTAVLGVKGAAITTAANQFWYMNAVNTSPIGTPEGISPGSTYIGYNSAIPGIVAAVGGNTLLSLRTYGVYINAVPLDVQTSVVIGTGTVSTLTGELGLSKIGPSGSAPGTGGLKLAAVAGTNAGTCKLIVYAGTSTTPSTLLDNIGSGC